MVSRLNGKKVIGIKQTTKAIKSGEAQTVYIAKDAEENVVKPVVSLALEHSLEVVYVESMKELGRLCGIDVGAASVAMLKES